MNSQMNNKLADCKPYLDVFIIVPPASFEVPSKGKNVFVDGVYYHFVARTLARTALKIRITEKITFTT